MSTSNCAVLDWFVDCPTAFLGEINQSEGYKGDLIATQGMDSCPPRGGEARSLDGIEAVVNASSAGKQAKRFSLRVDY